MLRGWRFQWKFLPDALILHTNRLNHSESLRHSGQGTPTESTCLTTVLTSNYHHGAPSEAPHGIRPK